MQPLDGRDDASEQSTTHPNLGQLEGDGAGVTDGPRPDFNQPGLQAGQRPISHLLGQVGLLPEDTEIVGQCMQLKPYLVVAEPLAGQPRPVDRLLALAIST